MEEFILTWSWCLSDEEDEGASWDVLAPFRHGKQLLHHSHTSHHKPWCKTLMFLRHTC